ncbi:MAG: hypothetical protein D6805_02905 [Planctomycetota bacterium]|nr:MAG: hypothetical protein D6805_02905 [Planctomycetota bacterium]
MGKRNSPRGRVSSFAKERSNQLGSFYGIVGGIFLLLVAIYCYSGLIVVPPKHVAVLIHKTGEDLPNGQILALKPEQKGILKDVLAEGWYWYNPYSWDFEIHPQVEVPEGKVGLILKLFGKDLEEWQILSDGTQKGVLREVLKPGRYLNYSNPYAYRIILKDAVTVPPGYRGVVVNMSGKIPKNTYDFLVGEGERGISRHTLEAGTHYVNPYVQKVIPVDVRWHLFKMIGEDSIRFPSKDGFEITMALSFEWAIDKNRLAEVYVKYVDERPVKECIVEKIVLPYVRSITRLEGSKYDAIAFFEKDRREFFRNKFNTELAALCREEGILIRSAQVRDVWPPAQIASIIQRKEEAKLKIGEFKSKQELALKEREYEKERKMKERKEWITKAKADQAVKIIEAQKRQEVAIIDAKRDLKLTKKEFVAAQNEALAIIREGIERAYGIYKRNEAEAAGLREAVESFGSGQLYVRYLVNQKLAPSIKYVLANTDGMFAHLLKSVLQPSSSKKIGPLPPLKRDWVKNLQTFDGEKWLSGLSIMDGTWKEKMKELEKEYEGRKRERRGRSEEK